MFVYFKLDDVYKVKAVFIVDLDRTTGQHIYTFDFQFLKLLDYDSCCFLKIKIVPIADKRNENRKKWFW